MTYPSNSESVAQGQIKAYVERILRLKEEARSINTDIREIYAEAKSNGFDKTALGKLVNYVEKREKDPDAQAESEAVFDLYLSAYYGAPSHTHAHARARVETIEEIPPEPDPVANVEEDATGAIAAASADPASREADGADRQQPATSGFTGDGGEAAAAPPVNTPNKQWKYTDKPHPDCLDPTQCGGFSNLGLCQRCKDAAAGVSL